MMEKLEAIIYDFMRIAFELRKTKLPQLKEKIQKPEKHILYQVSYFSS